MSETTTFLINEYILGEVAEHVISHADDNLQQLSFNDIYSVLQSLLSRALSSNQQQQVHFDLSLFRSGQNRVAKLFSKNKPMGSQYQLTLSDGKVTEATVRNGETRDVICDISNSEALLSQMKADQRQLSIGLKY